MAEFTGRLSNIATSYGTGRMLLTIEADCNGQTLFQMFDELKDAEKLTFKVGKFRKRRSLDANAYCWVLIGRIAEKSGVSNGDVYRAAIKEVGGNYDVVCVKSEAVDTLCSGWSRNGLGWITDTMPSKIDGCTNVVLYYGSSTYDTAQMSRLIKIIVQDCIALGIETKPQEEIESLLRSWGGA